MAYSEDILKLTGGKGFGFAFSGDDDKSGEDNKKKAEQPRKSEVNRVVVTEEIPDSHNNEGSTNPQDFVIESDLVTPVIKAVKDEEAKPLVVFVDDDFETLDLIDIYLKRDYTYESFSGPREAVFFLNHHTPEIVFIDCKIHTMKALTFMEIIRTGSGNENVPFVLVGTEEELKEFDLDYLPDYVIGKLKRPVARKELIDFITKVTEKKAEE